MGMKGMTGMLGPLAEHAASDGALFLAAAVVLIWMWLVLR